MIAHWIAGNSYSLIFLAMVIEGPVITAAAAFAAAVGIFNIYSIFVLSIFGSIVPDILYYAIGYWGRGRFVEKYGHYFGLKKSMMERAEKLIHEHAGKSLIAIKLIPLIATPGLIVAGITRMDIKKYMLWTLSITIPTSLFYLLIGYYFGAAYSNIIHYINIGGYIIAAAVILFIAILYFQKRFTERFAERIGLTDKKD